MDANQQQSQFELFPGTESNYDTTLKTRYHFAPVTLSWDNIIIAGIVIVILLTLFFSLGVERGRKLINPSGDSAQVNQGKGEGRLTDLPAAKQMPIEQLLPEQSEKESMMMKPSVMDSPQKIVAPAQESISGSGVSRYTIQVASFKEMEYAQREAADLKKKGYDILLLPKGGHVIVCVGKFTNKEKAVVTQNRLKKQYKDCLVRRL